MAFLAFASPIWAEPPPALSEEDYHPYNETQAALGQLLFYDKILSGNRNIACATCHHPKFGTSDGLSLGIGEGGVGLGVERDPNDIQKRVPRNAQALWNLGHRDVRVMFHDGRLEASDLYHNNFNSPAEEWLPKGFTSILAAQAVFPMVSQFEMAGNVGENEIIGAVNDRIDYAWPLIAKRVSEIETYVDLFTAAFEDVESAGDIKITHIGEAIGEFINAEWRSLDSPYDLWRRGEADLNHQQMAGLELFMGKGGCVGCHNGPLFSDQKYYALALPAFGPGRTRRFDMIARDQGRINESDQLEDIYRFRTPSLRNITLSAPYGHNGAYPDLDGIIRHHLDPLSALDAWQPVMAALPEAKHISAQDFIIQQDTAEMRRLRYNIDIRPRKLSDAEIDEIIAFMKTLTAPENTRQRLGIPESVPSALPVD